jgi:hypothetical protein
MNSKFSHLIILTTMAALNEYSFLSLKWKFLVLLTVPRPQLTEPSRVADGGAISIGGYMLDIWKAWPWTTACSVLRRGPRSLPVKTSSWREQVQQHTNFIQKRDRNERIKTTTIDSHWKSIKNWVRHTQ